MTKQLDAIDLKILHELQEDGRITNVELAKRVGISPPPCLRRVRALEDEGYIHGYRGLLDPKALGFDVTVFASVHLSSQADADLRAFEAFVNAQPIVRECWMLSGEVVAFAMVNLSSQAETDLKAFETHIRKQALVRECWMLSGEVDFILKCVASDMAAFQDFVTHLTAAPHVQNVRTSLVLHNSKYAPAVPLELKV